MKQLAANVMYSPSLGFIILSIPKPSLPETFEYNGITLEVKQELHVSLIGARKVAEEYGASEADIVATIEHFLAHNTVQFEKYTGEFYHCVKAETQTIIARAFMSGLEELYDELRKLPKLHALPSPVPHATLYKYNHQFGIPIPNEKTLAQLCTSLDAETSQQLTEIIYGEGRNYPL